MKKDYLKENGLKHTSGRAAILDVLEGAKGLMTAEQIHSKLKGKVHKVTLYRTLELFVKEGILYQTDLRSGQAYFELQKSHHHHIVCTECGLQEGIKGCPSSLQGEAANKSELFKEVTSHTLEFFGVCKKCSK